jgi:hypothetical protein
MFRQSTRVGCLKLQADASSAAPLSPRRRRLLSPEKAVDIALCDDDIPADNPRGTYRQYFSAGLQVMKDQHGQSVIFAGLTVKIETETNEVGEEEEHARHIRFLKAFVVFNVSQTDYKEKEYKLPDVKENPHLIGCDAVIHDYTSRHAITITAGDCAAYSPQTDMITCPYINRLTTSEHYYGTMFHECIHSTGPRLVPKSEITICRDDSVWSEIFQTRFWFCRKRTPEKF